MKRSEVFFGFLRVPIDALAVLAALLLSYRLRLETIDLIPGIQLLEPAKTLPVMETYLRSFAIPGVILFVLMAAMTGLYALRVTRSAWSEAGKVIMTASLWLVAIIAWYFLVQKELFYSRILLLHATFFMTAFVLLGRTSVVLLQRAFLRSGIGVRLVVSLGRQPITPLAERVLLEDIRYRYLGHLPDLFALRRIEENHHLDLVIQTDPDAVSSETAALIDECRSQHIGYAFLPPVFADVPHMLRVERLGLLPMMQFQPTPLDGWGRIGKRLFDLAVSAMLLCVLLPLFLLIAVAILLESGRPVLYISRRVGEQGRKGVAVLKFRSMVRNADHMKARLINANERNDGPLFKLRDDPRVTKVGRFLRRFDLDELPQLLNVLAGQMSLVGPRPHLQEEVQRYRQNQRRVFAVKPGITGLAQVSGRSALKFEDEVRLDLQYIEEWSLALDLWILWRTVFVVLGRRRE